MGWPKPEYSKTQINKAGDILISEAPNPNDLDEAKRILNNWRSCHGYPINTFQSTLRDKLLMIDRTALVAQRLKRSPSIVRKLQVFKEMKLARMQDIGGLRAVVSDLEKVRRLQGNYKASSFRHELVREDDYIANPKPSGYRSVHLVYRYKNERVPEYNGLLLELQIRTRLEHIWATAVETMGTFLRYALKSSEGPKAWLDFFSLTGSAFAHFEKCPCVPGYDELSEKETFLRVDQAAQELDVREILRGFTIAADRISTDKNAAYYLVLLNLDEKMVRIRSFKRDELENANREYTEAENLITEGKSIQAVLVSAGPIESLKRAYPNFFLDTREFIQQLDAMKKKFK